MVGQNDKMIIFELLLLVVLDDHQVPDRSVVGENVQRFDEDRARAFLHDDELVHTSVTRSDVEDVRKFSTRFNCDDG